VFPIVFYVSKEGFRVYDGKGGEQVCHYLEMSKNTLGESQWFPENSEIGTQIYLGYGKSNTYKILNAKKSKKLTEENCAAYICANYSTPNTKAGEWWLPSMCELDMVYKNQKDAVLASCTNERHWSSDQGIFKYVYCKNFYNDKWDSSPMAGPHKNSVRAVRAF